MRKQDRDTRHTTYVWRNAVHSAVMRSPTNEQTDGSNGCTNRAYNTAGQLNIIGPITNPNGHNKPPCKTNNTPTARSKHI